MSERRSEDVPALSASQLATHAELGEERAANAGEVLIEAGEQTYAFMAILEGEVAILDAARNELVRQGAWQFLGDRSRASASRSSARRCAARRHC